MTYSSRRKEVDMKKVIMIIAVAAILVGCKGKHAIWLAIKAIDYCIRLRKGY